MNKRASKRLRFKDNESDAHTKDTSQTMMSDNEDDDDNDSLNNHRMNTTYCTVTVKLPKNSDFIQYLHAKYTTLIDILLQADEELLVNQYDPKHDYINAKFIRNAEDLPTKMTALQRFVLLLHAVLNRAMEPLYGPIFASHAIANLKIS